MQRAERVTAGSARVSVLSVAHRIVIAYERKRVQARLVALDAVKCVCCVTSTAERAPERISAATSDRWR